jgi:hypothetical protein
MPNPKPAPGQVVDLAHPLASGLIGFWPFAEGQGANVYDAAGSRPLRLGTNFPANQTPLFNPANCWQFTARGPIGRFVTVYQQPPAVDQLDMAETSVTTPLYTSDVPFTLAVRFQVTVASTPNQQGITSTANSHGATNPGYLLQQNGANVNVLCGIGGSYRTVVPGVQADRWYTVSSRYTGAATRQNFHYRDGVLVLPLATNGLPATTSWPHFLFVANGFMYPNRCRIDWLGIWSRDLTTTEHEDIGSDPDAIWAMFPRKLVRRTVYGRAGSRRVRV